MNTTFATILEIVGTLAFAISGIRLAAAKQFDWFGAYAVGLVTAIGGGTLRDVLLNATPFWMINGSYLTVTAIALIFVIIFKQYLVKLENTFFIFDTIGLALFVVVGVEKTLMFGFPFWVATSWEPLRDRSAVSFAISSSTKNLCYFVKTSMP